MGFDLIGIEPLNKKGEYFRNNVWWWRRLAEYILSNCKECMTEEEFKGGWHFNDGHIISKESSLSIASRLKELLINGEVKESEIATDKYIKSLPKVECDICKGKGTRKEWKGWKSRATWLKYHKNLKDWKWAKKCKGCNGCDGTGKVDDWEAYYPFTEENVKKFVTFCKASGGFRIC